MKIIFRQVGDKFSESANFVTIPYILGTADTFAVSATANTGKSHPQLFNIAYGESYERAWSSTVDDALYSCRRYRRVTACQTRGGPLFFLVPPTFDSLKKSKLESYMRQLIAALKNYGISKLHFTHYSNLLSYPKDEEVRYVIKSLLLCDQDIDLQVCWDIQNRHVKYFKELYSEVALSQEGAAEFTSVPNSKFSWKSYKFDSSSRAVDLDGQGIYAAIYNGRLPASSVGKDRRRFEGGILLDPGSIKIGRAKNLRLRFGAYARDFGEDNIQFYPLNNSEDLRGDEARLKSIFGGVRLYSNHGRLLEWISPMSRHQFRLRIEKYLSSFHD